jgi:hypothetical protein
MSLPTDTPDVYTRVRVEKNVAVPMRDGIKLYANIYKPDADGKFPVILIRLPYGKDEPYCVTPAYGKYFARKGYACVVQDVRGKYASHRVSSSLLSMKPLTDTIPWTGLPANHGATAISG